LAELTEELETCDSRTLLVQQRSELDTDIKKLM